MIKHDWRIVTKDLLNLKDGGKEAWAYTTALRGPDSGDPDKVFKRGVTATIRGNCNTAYGIRMFSRYITAARLEKLCPYCSIAPEISYHMIEHAADGFDALRMWYQLEAPGELEVVKLLEDMSNAVRNRQWKKFMKARKAFQKLWDE